MDGALNTITEFVQSTRYEDIPRAAIARARDVLVDTLGCALGAHDCHAAKSASSFSKGAEGPSDDGCVIGRGVKVSPDLAAFWNTSMIRYLDFNDSGPSGGHPSDMLGSHIALSARARASGRDMLAAIVIGHEVYNRISDRVLFDDRRLDAGYGVALGSVAAGCHLLGLDAAVTRHALAISASSSVPIRVSRSGQLSDLKGYATALSVRDAIFYIHLAMSGLTGPSEPFEGRHGIVELLEGEPGTFDIAGFDDWTILGARIKYWQAAYNTHPSIWAALELRGKVRAEDIASVALGVNNRAFHESGSEPEKWSPKTRETADHSIPFLFSRALLDGTIDQASYQPASLFDRSVEDLMGKVTIEVDPDMAAQRPRLVLGCRARVTTLDGKRHEVLVDGIPGHESTPLTKDEIGHKFKSLSSPVLGADVDGAFETAWETEAVEDFGDVLQALVRSG
jgi:2-methylcitrate dehydratase